MKYSGFKSIARYEDDGFIDPLSVEERLLLLGEPSHELGMGEGFGGRVLYRIAFVEPLRLTAEDGELEVEYGPDSLPVRVTHGGREVPFTLEPVT